jgi:hypothetical protein
LEYPTASLDIRETLSKDQFVDAFVDSEMRIRIKQSRPGNINEAIKLAVELEPILDPMPKRVYDAGGKALNVSGKGDFTPKVGSFSCTVNAAVADLTVDGIIGLDFLTEYSCTVDM